ncbi:MAG TPA: hypothetical protein VH251_00625, partial [Verrucomicrobiae bacterium]|nr:hypothetical protein [Verrucomicrobiae bacterium]
GTLSAASSIKGFSVYGDASVDTNSGVIACDVGPSTSNTSFQPAGGTMHVNVIPPYTGVTVGNFTSYVELTGTPAALSKLFANGNVTYNPGASTNANCFSITLKQETGNILTNQYYLPIVYTYQ